MIVNGVLATVLQVKVISSHLVLQHNKKLCWQDSLMGTCTNVLCFCVLSSLAQCLSILSNFTHAIQTLLNSLWLSLALTILERLGRRPNYTTGQLTQVPSSFRPIEDTSKEDFQVEVPIEIVDTPQIQRTEICYLRETRV